MNNIQKLISEMEVRSKSHLDRVLKSDPLLSDYNFYSGRQCECDFVIAKLKLLLKDESKQPQPRDFANTMLGKVPHEVNVEHQESSQAVEGATPVVRQNEQTKEHCNHKWVRGYRAYKCSKCSQTMKAGLS